MPLFAISCEKSKKGLIMKPPPAPKTGLHRGRSLRKAKSRIQDFNPIEHQMEIQDY